MAVTYEPIATTTLGSAAATITFSSIPSTYTDLKLVIVAKQALWSADFLQLRFNSDATTAYSFTTLYASGGSPASNRNISSTVLTLNTAGGMNTIPGLYTADIFSYSNGSIHKTIQGMGAEDWNNAGGITNMVGTWRQQTAINSILIRTNGANTLSAGTTATLYGILKA